MSATAKLGPHVVIGAGCVIGEGVRIINSILLDGVEVKVKHLFNIFRGTH